MIHFAIKGHESSLSVGVQPVTTIDALEKAIDRHFEETGDRFCPFFVTLQAGMRLPRWAARAAGRKGFAIRTDPGQEAVLVSTEDLPETRFFGKYMTDGRLFYDALALEVPMNLSAMQRLS